MQIKRTKYRIEGNKVLEIKEKNNNIKKKEKSRRDGSKDKHGGRKQSLIPLLQPGAQYVFPPFRPLPAVREKKYHARTNK